MPDDVEQYCAALDPDPYGRTLVLRLPAMLRVLAANLRSGAEGRGAVINAYLPPRAAHNLALAAELALAQGDAVAMPQPVEPVMAAGVAARLRNRMSLVFAKETLEKSIQMVAEEIGVPIEIRGPDLQLEGITKNQSFDSSYRDCSSRSGAVVWARRDCRPGNSECSLSDVRRTVGMCRERIVPRLSTRERKRREAHRDSICDVFADKCSYCSATKRHSITGEWLAVIVCTRTCADWCLEDRRASDSRSE
jgi:hypothetical protein